MPSRPTLRMTSASRASISVKPAAAREWLFDTVSSLRSVIMVNSSTGSRSNATGG